MLQLFASRKGFALHQDEKTSVTREQLFVVFSDRLNVDIRHVYADRVPAEAVQDLSFCHFKLLQAAFLNQHETASEAASLLRSLCVTHHVQSSLLEQIQFLAIRALAKRLAARRQSRRELLSVSLPIILDVASVMSSALSDKAAGNSIKFEMAGELS